MNVQGLVFDIQRYSLHDGPGIRTTVFLKGCPLRCVWCHNPESKAYGSELFFTPSLCIDCGSCDEVCENGAPRVNLSRRADGDSACVLCLRCGHTCPSGAIQQVGREMTVEEVLDEVEKDRVFYEESGGGLTLSGGEPMAQFNFTRELLRGARSRGIDTCLETCGIGSEENYKAILPLVDLFLWDVKDTDANRHVENTGVSLKPALDNLACVDARDGKTLLRCILIEGVNLTDEHIDSVALLFSRLSNAVGVELLPYHPLGGSKFEQLGIPRPEWHGQVPGKDRLVQVRDRLLEKGVPVLVE